MATGVNYYRLREVRRAGKRDGRNWKWKFVPLSWPPWEIKEPDPPVDQKEPSQYEANLISFAHANLERIGKGWSQEDERLTAEYCNAKGNKENLEKEKGLADEEIKDAVDRFEEARERFLAFPPRWVPLWLYWSIFIVISLAEGFFNLRSKKGITLPKNWTVELGAC